MAQNRNPSATGIETDSCVGSATDTDHGQEVARAFALSSPHLRLSQIILVDVTDRHNELVHEQQWLLHPSEGLSLSGNLFVIENLAEGSGMILIKQAPLPWARPTPVASDLRITPRKGIGFDFALLETPGCTADSWEILEYRGGFVQRTCVLHEWQSRQRPATPSHALPRFLTNTWGDRSQDSRIRADFIEAEIDAAHQLGVDVVQIDDGWQRGVTANSAEARQRGGVWEGFWNADPNFWTPHPERFRLGLQPIADRARAKGMNIGLWFAPDSWNEFSNWRQDADLILDIFTTVGVEHFKVDGVKATTELAFQNLRRFFKAALDGSQGKVVFDLDITAGIRPGYFGAMEVGPLFVENRYTDWHKYWPHQTLRNLWKLSRWVDPRRLRMEFLNNTRNVELYANDPLAPSHYTSATLFATVMFSNPLGWFEVSNLPRFYLESVSELVQTWKTHRENLFGGSIIPIGEEPDGFSYTGFMSLSETHDDGYILIFRELHPKDQISFELPNVGLEECKWELLVSEGTVESRGDMLLVNIPKRLGFLFARFTRAKC
ncbi:MAG: alpha-galactosidase [Verrucomicrobia bacterium]|nr:alpha-galactosidase [Verrucomicrobiota bacterium]MCG2681912.1 alpha-galactosidase [Kiritimatiellia bacterium]MBU4246752.1 alpha-galactosidase [Verrucomicrobiota bacterium]MBU4291173.1 alpha-galactosidase [Verrucomicrobiota bacterium]MBU4428943.1 alpha-galactosidase [Verrucomicrobiota bacterium]